MSRKFTDETVDLSLEGFSVTFDGFPIFVKHRDRVAAEGIIRILLESAGVLIPEQGHTGVTIPITSAEESPHFKKFLFCSLFAGGLPFVLHLAALYHLYLSFNKQEKLRPVYLLTGLLFFAGSLAVGVMLFSTQVERIKSLFTSW